jgi:hypothetical protein
MAGQAIDVATRLRLELWLDPADWQEATPKYSTIPHRHARVWYFGFYIGAHVGGGWLDSNSTVVTNTGAAFPPGSVSSPKASGILGGGQLGWNWQIGQWVLGIEGDYSWSGMDGDNAHASTVVPPKAFSSFERIEAKIDSNA